MLLFSSSVGLHWPTLATHATSGIPTTTTTQTNPSAHQQKATDKVYKFGKNPVLESDKNEEKDTCENQEPSTQEETLTLSTSDPTGFTQSGFVFTQYSEQAGNQGVVTTESRPEISDDNQKSIDDSVSDRNNFDHYCITPGSRSETDSTFHSTSSEEDVAQEIRPVTGVRVPKYNFAQKRHIVSKAFSQPKRICSTSRKYRISHGSIHHWRHILQNAGLSYRKNLRIAETNGDFIDGDGERVVENHVDMAGGEDDNELVESVWVGGCNRRCMIHPGCPSNIPQWASIHLKRYFNSLYATVQLVTMNDLVNKYVSICLEETEEATYTALRQRM